MQEKRKGKEEMNRPPRTEKMPEEVKKEAGKGPTPRAGAHSEKWDDCPLWWRRWNLDADGRCGWCREEERNKDRR
ncbi:hypothetical protein D4R42_01470 [bacterium]|nr:MAG: hypothetical protein D4R42_01470 [bacterium]